MASSHATIAFMADHPNMQRLRTAALPASRKRGPRPRRQSEHQENPPASCLPPTALHDIVPYQATALIEGPAPCWETIDRTDLRLGLKTCLKGNVRFRVKHNSPSRAHVTCWLSPSARPSRSSSSVAQNNANSDATSCSPRRNISQVSALSLISGRCLKKTTANSEPPKMKARRP